MAISHPDCACLLCNCIVLWYIPEKQETHHSLIGKKIFYCFNNYTEIRLDTTKGASTGTGMISKSTVHIILFHSLKVLLTILTTLK